MLNVTVIIPFYSGGDFIINALNSIKNQTQQPRKVIIINDKSPNSEVLKGINYVDYKFEIEILTNPLNLGPGIARNRGMELSTSKYLAFLDEDDTWHQKKLEYQIGYMESYSREISSTDLVISDLGQEIPLKPALKTTKLRQFNLLIRNKICTSSVVMSDKIYKKFYFDKNIRFAEDFELWLRITRNYDFYLINQPLTIRHLKKDFSNLSYRFRDMLLGEIYSIDKNVNSYLIRILIKFYLRFKYFKRVICFKLFS